MSGKSKKVEPAGRDYFPLPDLSRKIERDSARRVGLPLQIIGPYVRSRHAMSFHITSYLSCYTLHHVTPKSDMLRLVLPYHKTAFPSSRIVNRFTPHSAVFSGLVFPPPPSVEKVKFESLTKAPMPGYTCRCLL